MDRSKDKNSKKSGFVVKKLAAIVKSEICKCCKIPQLHLFFS